MVGEQTQSTAARLPKPVRITDQQWPEDTVPTVSVFSWAYNHASFISESVDSILMQETTFPVEIIIHDDASTDGTTDIIRNYEFRHPRLFQNILQSENQWSQGKSVMDPLYSKPRGKYVALLHGDDYWTASDKLQSQIDVLRMHPDVTLCYHSHQLVNEAGQPLPSRAPRDRMELFEQGDFIRGKFGDLTTASILYRKSLLDPLPAWYLDLPFGDINLYALASLRGKVAVIPGVHSAYRRHSGGIYSASCLASDEDFHFSKELWWRRAICDLFRALASETDDRELKQICLKRAFDEHMEASWFARTVGKSDAAVELVLDAFRCSPGNAVRGSFWWKQLFFGLFPDFDLKRLRRLEAYRQKREDLLQRCARGAE